MKTNQSLTTKEAQARDEVRRGGYLHFRCESRALPAGADWPLDQGALIFGIYTGEVIR